MAQHDRPFREAEGPRRARVVRLERPEDGDEPRDVVHPRPVPHCGGDPERHGEHDGEQHRDEGELEGRHEARHEVGQHRLVGDERIPEVAVQHAGDVADVLLPQRVVEPGLLGDPLAHLGARERAHHEVDRIAGDDPGQRERDDRHAEEDRNQEEQTAGDEDEHG